MQNQNSLLSPLSKISNPSFEAPFTEAEITAAEQLIQLSESSGGATSSCSGGSGSVHAPEDDVAEDDEWLWRRNKRYRLISDLYASTAQIDQAGHKNKENRKRKG